MLEDHSRRLWARRVEKHHGGEVCDRYHRVGQRRVDLDQVRRRDEQDAGGHVAEEHADGRRTAALVPRQDLEAVHPDHWSVPQAEGRPVRDDAPRHRRGGEAAVPQCRGQGRAGAARGGRRQEERPPAAGVDQPEHRQRERHRLRQLAGGEPPQGALVVHALLLHEHGEVGADHYDAAASPGDPAAARDAEACVPGELQHLGQLVGPRGLRHGLLLLPPRTQRLLYLVVLAVQGAAQHGGGLRVPPPQLQVARRLRDLQAQQRQQRQRRRDAAQGHEGAPGRVLPAHQHPRHEGGGKHAQVDVDLLHGHQHAAVLRGGEFGHVDGDAGDARPDAQCNDPPAEA
mmetsp:Transcript_66956/g.181074  ORF Transcript_66956/g.181074 Transcript_66956/m.181074 type:complete len:343 (-) Transcript_66956:425-1453(-)